MQSISRLCALFALLAFAVSSSAGPGGMLLLGVSSVPTQSVPRAGQSFVEAGKAQDDVELGLSAWHTDRPGTARLVASVRLKPRSADCIRCVDFSGSTHPGRVKRVGREHRLILDATTPVTVNANVHYRVKGEKQDRVAQLKVYYLPSPALNVNGRPAWVDHTPAVTLH